MLVTDDQICGLSLSRKQICLTFDDGPGKSPSLPKGPKTLELAEYLASEQIKAAFFFTAPHAKENGEIARGVVSLGHIVGNHTVNHLHLLNPEYKGRHIEEVQNANLVLQEFYLDKNVYFRAPYGEWGNYMSEDINKLDDGFNYFGPYKWTIDSYDYGHWEKDLNVDIAYNHCMNVIKHHQRGIVVMHDSSADNPTALENNMTFDMVKLLIPELKKEEYQFVSLDQINY